mmetsp:Transcript_21190/g.41422  ORF Transcript_21190/g.41422 Transcript_21190/m.41422 type:complete len:148 (+) Transcript_21190:58-501(+)
MRAFGGEETASKDAPKKSKGPVGGTSMPARSREGWGLMVTGLGRETEEDDIEKAFAAFGEILALRMPLEAMTGFVKGYCMLEYKQKEEAEAAIRKLDGQNIGGSTVSVNWLCEDAGTATGCSISGEQLHGTSDCRNRSRSPPSHSKK